MAKSSPYRGVTLFRPTGKWRAQISAVGKTVSLGDHDTEEEAAHTFDRAAINKGGRKAKTNFPMSEYETEVTELTGLSQEDLVAMLRSRARKSTSHTSSYRGVSLLKQTGKWHAQINVGGKQVHLGFFLSEQLAAKAYDRAAINKSLHEGQKAATNFDMSTYRDEMKVLTAMKQDDFVAALADEERRKGLMDMLGQGFTLSGAQAVFGSSFMQPPGGKGSSTQAKAGRAHRELQALQRDISASLSVSTGKVSTRKRKLAESHLDAAAAAATPAAAAVATTPAAAAATTPAAAAADAPGASRAASGADDQSANASLTSRPSDTGGQGASHNKDRNQAPVRSRRRAPQRSAKTGADKQVATTKSALLVTRASEERHRDGSMEAANPPATAVASSGAGADVDKRPGMGSGHPHLPEGQDQPGAKAATIQPMAGKTRSHAQRDVAQATAALIKMEDTLAAEAHAQERVPAGQAGADENAAESERDRRLLARQMCSTGPKVRVNKDLPAATPFLLAEAQQAGQSSIRAPAAKEPLPPAAASAATGKAPKRAKRTKAPEAAATGLAPKSSDAPSEAAGSQQEVGRNISPSSPGKMHQPTVPAETGIVSAPADSMSHQVQDVARLGPDFDPESSPTLVADVKVSQQGDAQLASLPTPSNTPTDPHTLPFSTTHATPPTDPGLKPSQALPTSGSGPFLNPNFALPSGPAPFRSSSNPSSRAGPPANPNSYVPSSSAANPNSMLGFAACSNPMYPRSSMPLAPGSHFSGPGLSISVPNPSSSKPLGPQPSGNPLSPSYRPQGLHATASETGTVYQSLGQGSSQIPWPHAKSPYRGGPSQPQPTPHAHPSLPAGAQVTPTASRAQQQPQLAAQASMAMEMNMQALQSRGLTNAHTIVPGMLPSSLPRSSNTAWQVGLAAGLAATANLRPPNPSVGHQAATTAAAARAAAAFQASRAMAKSQQSPLLQQGSVNAGTPAAPDGSNLSQPGYKPQLQPPPAYSAQSQAQYSTAATAQQRYAATASQRYAAAAPQLAQPRPALRPPLNVEHFTFGKLAPQPKNAIDIIAEDAVLPTFPMKKKKPKKRKFAGLEVFAAEVHRHKSRMQESKRNVLQCQFVKKSPIGRPPKDFRPRMPSAARQAEQQLAKASSVTSLAPKPKGKAAKGTKGKAAAAKGRKGGTPKKGNRVVWDSVPQKRRSGDRAGGPSAGRQFASAARLHQEHTGNTGMDQLLGALGPELEAHEAEEGSDSDDDAVSGTDQGGPHRASAPRPGREGVSVKRAKGGKTVARASSAAARGRGRGRGSKEALTGRGGKGHKRAASSSPDRGPVRHNRRKTQAPSRAS
ncbi:hypothetical protein WJX82_008034 [Trebouxia sp. C0006]